MINIEDHTKLIHNVIKNIDAQRKGYEYQDLFQIGCIGLVKAGKTYAKERNIKFSTYATRCIKNEIFRTFQCDKWLVGSSYDRIDGIAKPPVSLEKEIKEGFDFYKFMKCEDNLEKNILDKLEIEQFFKTNSLTDRERKILYLYFFRDYTTIEIGEVFKCTYQSISKIKNKAIKKIQQNISKQGEYMKKYFKVPGKKLTVILNVEGVEPPSMDNLSRELNLELKEISLEEFKKIKGEN